MAGMQAILTCISALEQAQSKQVAGVQGPSAKKGYRPSSRAAFKRNILAQLSVLESERATLQRGMIEPQQPRGAAVSRRM